MNKQKTLLFSLSAMLFLAVSFIVYSWAEPTTMPSSYNPPINTSSTAQTKTGEIGATVFRDADNSNYYINPSGNSVVSGTISAANPTANNHIATKGYIDNLFSNVDQEMSLSNLSYVTGVNPQCPTDSITIMRNWTPKVCSAFGSCITGGVLFQNVTTAPTCTYQTAYGSNYVTCTSGGWTAAICAKVGQPLYNSEHTVDQCEFWNGTVVSDGVDTFCRFDSGVCPATWKQFKNWSTTIPATSGYPTHEWNVWAGTVYTGSHAWSNTARESYYCFYNSAKDECVVGYNYGYGGETVYATTTQIGCY